MSGKHSGARRRRRDQEEQHEAEPTFGFLGGLANLLEKLGDLAEKGKELQELREFQTGQGVRGVYGVSIRTAGGGETGQFKVEPFGNVKHDEQTGRTTLQEVQEPMVDVFEEPDCVLVVAEMPGIGKGDVQLALEGDVLSVSAARGKKKYHKDVPLPRKFQPEDMSFSCRNGMLEVRFAHGQQEQPEDA